MPYIEYAFPIGTNTNGGLTKLEYFLIHSSWEPSKEAIQAEITRDRNKNPFNDDNKPRIRGHAEIVADLKIENAKQVLLRAKTAQ